MAQGFEALEKTLGGGYRIERELGRGGMATVYLAQDLKHRRRVAIKVMRPDLAAVLGGQRFLREVEIAARLNHPHIVPLFDSGASDGFLYYVMPCIEGESLRARLQREGPLPVEDAVRVAREIASALGYAHQQGVVHRDIKPENVLLSDGIALVADFGIARAMSAPEDSATITLATHAGTVLGTPAYMSPEQATGKEADGRADLYALACVLFEMLAGEPPFVAPTLEDILRMHVTVEPRPVAERRATVPGGVSSAIAKSLAKDPALRFATAARFAEALVAGMTGAAAPDVPGTTVPNNLPRRRTQFIGRKDDLAECARLLVETGMLTVTGIGGCGKTRLALELADSLLGTFRDGVWFVDLAPLTDEARVPETLAVAMGVREIAGKSVIDAMTSHLRGKRHLLVLDNCEHVLRSCADLVTALQAAGDGLGILATSRERLGIDGESVFALPPLGVPSVESSRDPHAALASEAVKLFVDRARIGLGGFDLTEANVSAVTDICRRLDGIPLAIELAAARARILSVEQIRSRLDDRFKLLTGGSKAALPRHQTLMATIQWSYDQLSVEEQRFFRLVSVFAGGWTLESATRVAESDEFAVMDLLARLVDKSLVLVERDRDAEPRYTFLETVRQYAEERLEENGESEDAQSRHFAEFMALAENAYAERFVREDTWVSRLDREHDNLRAALECVRAPDAERYLALAGSLGWFWQARTYLLEGRAHLTAALAASAPDPPRSARARGLWGAANMLVWQGDAASARRWMVEALTMWRHLGDLREVALALEGIGWAELLGGDEVAACATFEESLHLQRGLGDAYLINRAKVAFAQTLVALGRTPEARTLSKEVIAFSREHDDRRNEHFGWHFLADCALIEGDCNESLSLYRKSLELAEAIGDRLETTFEVQGVAMSLAGLGDTERGLRLAAAVDAERERLAVDARIRFWDALLERYLGSAKLALHPDEAARIDSAGRKLPFAEAVVAALTEEPSAEGTEKTARQADNPA